MTKFLVRFIMSFRPLWRSMQVDLAQLEAILTAKLTMDTRRTRSFQMGASNNNSGQSWLPTVIYFFMGLLFMFMVLGFQDRMTGLTIYFSAFMVMFAMTLITDFTDVLIDVRDNYILFPRPVDDRTITVARVMHIFVYLLKLIVPFSLPTAIYLVVADGVPGLLIFAVQVLLAVLLVIFIVNLLYLLILQITSPRRFREIINYFQIAFTIIIFACYYLLPNLIDFSDIKGARVMDAAATPFIPSAWIAAISPLLLEGQTRQAYWIMSTLAIVVPLICIYLVGSSLAGNFNQKMMAIAEGGDGAKTDRKLRKTTAQSNWMRQLSTRLCSSPVEQAGFEWVWMLTRRSRDYKLRVYPAFGFVPLYFLYFGLQGEGTIGERIEQINQGHSYLMLIYFSGFIILTALTNLAFSDKYKASWIMKASPVGKPGELLAGALKAILVQFFLPVFLLMVVIVVPFWGWHTIDDCLVGFFNLLLFEMLAAVLLFRKVPFSESWGNQNKGSNFANGMVMIIAASVVGFVHYGIVLLNQPLILPALAVVSALLSWLLYRAYRNTSWQRIK